MTNNKLTNKKALELAIKAIDTANFHTPDFKADEIIEKLEKMLAQVEKKGGADRKPTAKQMENEGLKTAILSYMTVERLMTVTELMKEVPELDGMSNQKVSALVKQLKDAGLVEKQVDKGRSLFHLSKQ